MKNKILIVTLLACISFVCLSWTTKFQAEQDSNWEVPEAYTTMKNPYANTIDTENVGRALFLKHCKLCHGQYGKGDGIMAENLDIEIADFTKATIQAQTDGSLYYKFLFGRNEMPAFKAKIKNEEDRWLLINYLRKLGE
ncbi:c-type cytochrome [Aestuariivivens sp. NBU2969]|uniref:c-type cytochrome n=1 Tax=Aestuariivivens sp. NBU2969 TaxID=2873267 RepID=UPI001CC05FB0|nr:c-type cytochrome [Aestuariivivens sp. NBU2969]